MHIINNRINAIIPQAYMSKKRYGIMGALGLCAAVVAAPLAAQSETPESSKFPTPKTLENIIACQKITDNAERLRCFDSSVSQFSDAAAKGDVIIAEKEVVNEARKEVFGLSLSDNPIFGSKDDEGVNSIETTIKSVSRLRDGKLIFVLEDGAQWRQTDTRPLRRDPKPGQKIVIERALLGSFKASIGDESKTIKVLRVR